ncbi:hypothetical protein [Natronococcus sp. A-GB7]|jgi:hypothetical protein|uniref:hypothetical protein n=1 Tax=Natronococcus sp. A-GB7 TaxID=3037649 RepID=UPI00241D1E7A|nr:hypothetical protein [Natronococcus sp. A-GB7]MDG5818158.1 hypothetical protein [Natronococcus sp. A-GB7]
MASKTRAAGTCTKCGNVFAVRQSDGGAIEPIGVRQCSCGGTSFEVLESGPTDPYATSE